MQDAIGAVTEGTLLGGRVRYRQPATGFRTGIEPVLLAASVAARPGERVLEGGTGAGAALLCLSARLPGVTVHGVERDAALAALARDNIAANALPLASVATSDIAELAPDGSFAHAIANPPWHGAAGTASPLARREAAKRAVPGLLQLWAARLAGMVQPGGSLTLLVPASAMAEVVEAVGTAGCGGATLMPLWPRAGQEARLLLLRTVKGGRSPSRILPGLALHEGEGFTAAARAILWDAAPLAW